jgi:hypothetical protein
MEREGAGLLSAAFGAVDDSGHAEGLHGERAMLQTHAQPATAWWTT